LAAPEPFSGALYVFRAKRADGGKIVWWAGSGLCLFAKRLDEDKSRWPQVENGMIRLAASQLMAPVEGIDWTRLVPPDLCGTAVAKWLMQRKDQRATNARRGAWYVQFPKDVSLGGWST
jgi:transposase